MKIALFGAWHVHAPGYVKVAMQYAEVIGFFEEDDTLAAAFLEKCPGVQRFASAEELLRSNADAVIVCSATSRHKEDIVAIAEAGKDIFTEKVLALTDADCAEIEAAVKRNNVRFVISCPHKFFGAVKTVKQIADSGELGKISCVRYRNAHSGSVNDWLPPHFYNREECGGGAMIDLGAHGMYMIHSILGEPITARSAFTRFCDSDSVAAKNCDGVEDNAVTTLIYESGAIAVNETGFVTDKGSIIFEIHGERGYAVMERERVRKSSVDTAGELVEVELLPTEELPIAVFAKGGTPAGCGIDVARALTRIMEMAYANA